MTDGLNTLRTMSRPWFRARNEAVPALMGPSWGPHPRGLIWAVRAPRVPRMLMALAAAPSVPFVIVKSGDAAWEVH